MTPAQTIYRADIDGLRAISILAVVLFHFGVPYFDGGFVGVDVFFVISGYLITNLVVSDLRKGSFSFANFYARRARRLMPTLVIVMAVTFAAALAIMTPEDFAAFSKSLFYTLIFAANLFFADQGGYFASSLELAPLLHMWSLAIEEQFYFIWPLLCVVAFRYAPRHLLTVAVLALVASFAASVAGVEQRPLAAFFQPHTRIWELLFGCVLALRAVPLRPLAADLVGIVGFGLILAAVFGFDGRTPFPGTSALVPVLGATFVIWSSRTGPSLVGRVLSAKPLVFIGLVSYAWYLWHWPLITFFRYQLERNPSGVETVVMIALSFALAVACWAFVERPVRQGLWWKPRWRTFGTALAAALPLVALAAVGYVSNGFIGRYPEAIRGLTREELSTRGKDWKCAKSAQSVGDRCPVWRAGDDAPGILLWGDSHAAVIRSVFRDAAEQANVSVAYIGLPGCPPLTGAGRKRRHNRPDTCQNLNAEVDDLLRWRKYSDVVLVARWDYYAVGKHPSEENDPEQHYLRDDKSTSASLAENKAVMARGLQRTIEAVTASGARAWLVMEPPYVGYNTPNRLAREIMNGQSPDRMFGIGAAEKAKRSAFIRELVAGLPVTVIDPAEVLCDADHCLAVDGGKPLYFDDNHLSIYGTARLAPLLEGLIAHAKERVERARAEKVRTTQPTQ
jgi:peptidoglycan/LPS O-acetylase OafA/YrhL